MNRLTTSLGVKRHCSAWASAAAKVSVAVSRTMVARMRVTSCDLGVSVQSRRGDVGALAQGAQFLPGDRRIDLAVAGKGTEAAVGAGNHALAADDADKALEALRDELGVLDAVRARVDQTRCKHLVLGNLRSAPPLPFVRVARIGRLE